MSNEEQLVRGFWNKGEGGKKREEGGEDFKVFLALIIMLDAAIAAIAAGKQSS